MSDAAENTGSLDMDSAGDALEALYGGAEAQEETQEDAAARLAAEEAANQNKQSSEENAEEENDEPANAPETVTIEVDGKPVQMTKAELAEAVKGQMRQADYTQKTMAVADEVRAAKAEKDAAAAERADLANKLHVYSVQQSGALANIEAQLTEELLHSDPIQYMALERTLRQGQANLAKANSDLAAMQQQYQAEQQEAGKKFIQDQHGKLVAKVPDWKDPAKMKAEFQQIESFMEEQGFTPEFGQMLLDARTILMARDAMKYRDLMARASQVPKKVAEAPPKVERPGVATTKPHGNDARVQALKKLEKSGGKLQDAADAFALFM